MTRRGALKAFGLMAGTGICALNAKPAEGQNAGQMPASPAAKNLAATSQPAAQNLAYKMPVKIGFLPILDHLAITAKELFKNECFLIVPIKFASWADAAEALRSGSVDGAFLLAPLGMALAANGAPIKAVMAAHKEGSALVGAAGIENIYHLKGKNIGVPSRFSTHYFLLDKLLSKHGLKGACTIIDMAPTEMPFALLSGRLDAFIAAEPFCQIAIKRGRAKKLIKSGDIQKNHICCVLNLRDNILKSPILNDLVASFRAAAGAIAGDSELGASLGEQILGQPKELIKEIIEQKDIYFNDTKISLNDLLEIKEFLIKNDLANERLKRLDLREYLL